MASTPNSTTVTIYVVDVLTTGDAGGTPYDVLWGNFRRVFGWLADARVAAAALNTDPLWGRDADKIAPEVGIDYYAEAREIHRDDYDAGNELHVEARKRGYLPAAWFAGADEGGGAG